MNKITKASNKILRVNLLLVNKVTHLVGMGNEFQFKLCQKISFSLFLLLTSLSLLLACERHNRSCYSQLVRFPLGTFARVIIPGIITRILAVKYIYIYMHIYAIKRYIINRHAFCRYITA